MKLLTVLGNAGLQQQGQLVVCNMSSSYVDDHVRSAFDIAKVDASLEARALTLTWKKRGQTPRWMSSSDVYSDVVKDDVQFFHRVVEFRDRIRSQGGGRYEPSSILNVPQHDVEVVNLEKYGSFISNQERYLVPGSALVKYLAQLNASQSEDRLRSLASAFIFLEVIRSSNWTWDIMNSDLYDRAAANSVFSSFRMYLDKSPFLKAIRETNSATFDSYAWDRRQEGQL